MSLEEFQTPKYYGREMNGVPPDQLADIPTISDQTKAWLERPHQDLKASKPPVRVQLDVEAAIARVRAAKIAIILAWREPRGVSRRVHADT